MLKILKSHGLLRAFFQFYTSHLSALFCVTPKIVHLRNINIKTYIYGSDICRHEIYES